MVADPFGRSESMSRVLWAISSGGLTGSGMGYGQAHRIPEVQSDFSFVAVCEEMGFVGGFAVILAYAALIVRCLRIASAADNVYKKTLVTGIATLIGIQSFLIICGNLGGIPLTGITLPLVSYGGSALLINFLMIGIVLRISGEEKR
jgi:cell division protein FtsW (lipid II flippase)